MLKFGSNNIGKVLFGSNVIGKAYYGSNLVYSSDGGGGGGGGEGPYDSEIEFLQTNGSPYIDLGREGNAATDAFFVDFQATEFVSISRIIAPNQSGGPCQMYINSSDKFAFRQGTKWVYPPVDGTVGTTRHTWLCDYYNLVNTIDGVDYAMAASSSGESSSNILLVGPYPSAGRFKGKIYACKIYRSGTMVADMIPVRVGNVGYMYDKISEELFGNVGTGSFTLGNDK